MEFALSIWYKYKNSTGFLRTIINGCQFHLVIGFRALRLLSKLDGNLFMPMIILSSTDLISRITSSEYDRGNFDSNEYLLRSFINISGFDSIIFWVIKLSWYFLRFLPKKISYFLLNYGKKFTCNEVVPVFGAPIWKNFPHRISQK